MNPSVYLFDLGGAPVRVADDEIAVDTEGRIIAPPGVVARLRSLAGVPIFILTNQAGVALAALGDQEAIGYVEQLRRLTAGAVTAYRICTQHPAAGCACRKPRPGMLLALVAAHAVDLRRAVMIGDSVSEECAAAAAGVGRFCWATEFLGWIPLYQPGGARRFAASTRNAGRHGDCDGVEPG